MELPKTPAATQYRNFSAWRSINFAKYLSLRKFCPCLNRSLKWYLQLPKNKLDFWIHLKTKTDIFSSHSYAQCSWKSKKGFVNISKHMHNTTPILHDLNKTTFAHCIFRFECNFQIFIYFSICLIVFTTFTLFIPFHLFLFPAHFSTSCPNFKISDNNLTRKKHKNNLFLSPNIECGGLTSCKMLIYRWINDIATFLILHGNISPQSSG